RDDAGRYRRAADGSRGSRCGGELCRCSADREQDRSRGREVGMESMVDLAKFGATGVCREPFDFLVVPGFLKAGARAAINADYPPVTQPGSFPLESQRYGPAFAALIDELRGEAVQAAFERKFGLDLTDRPTMFTVRGRCSDRDGGIHTDSATKI